MTPGHDTTMDNTLAEREIGALAFDRGLLAKYGGAGPRYTSYPSADRFTETVAGTALARAIRERRVESETRGLSLYVHLPFCNTICFYCGCNKVVTRDRSRSGPYVRYLAKEIALLAADVEPGATVRQMHWGGGTPTFLSSEEIAELNATLRDRFEFAPDAECSIEVDPRGVTSEVVEALADCGFNRMSVGVQDFDADVQRAVNRLQSEEQTRAVLDSARANGFRSLNVDLIYGLPKQSAASFARTLEKVVAAAPDRVALYSYAHVPHLFKAQRRISEAELPSPEEKLAILELAIERFAAAGYVYIGMDHFARPDDELARAQRDGRLHRNFQGYSTDAQCDLLAFGVSAISAVGRTYAQNLRTLDEYYRRLDAGALAAFRGFELSADDVLRRDVIQALMCQFTVSFGAIEAAHDIVFADRFALELELLRPLAVDGLVTLGADAIDVTPRGRLLVRAVAMIFDRYLREQQATARYSRVA